MLRQALAASLVGVCGIAATATVIQDADAPAAARNYWAFRLPVQAPVPAVSARFDHPIDRFLEHVREEKGLKPAPRAGRETLLRRAYLDLIGMPPTPAQAAAFLDDTSPGAWERVIDALLASPHYGERWGRHWLDVARYADSSGFEQDYDRPNAWRYRDYVIRAFNQDKPYDVFLKEQIAGDELDARTDETFIATGFLRAGPRVAFREKDNPERRYEYLDDLIATTGRGVLGLTVQCARCHNHKFDPIPQRDYYSLVTAFFGYVETTRLLVTRARHGLGVMRRPLPALTAALFQLSGWICQLLAVWTAMFAFHIHEPLPAAGLVLLLMNVATIFPLWPGNVGLLQAAVALPLVSYGVAYYRGFAYGIGLQAIEASVGIGIGLLFLVREGLSYAMLRSMPQATETEEKHVESELPEHAGAGVS